MLQAYTEELVDLHRRLMALRERNVLQQVCVHAPQFDFTCFKIIILCHVSCLIDRLILLSRPPQIVNLIEETGHFNVTNTTFDFDLFSLDESTVRKLQSYLEATAT